MRERHEIIAMLVPSSTSSERTTALVEAGLPGQTIADAAGASKMSVSNWLNGVCEPRGEHGRVLDDLRFAVHGLMTAEIELSPGAATNWLVSREASPPHLRPIDQIKDNPEGVIEKMHTYIQSLGVNSGPA